jgi:glycosyltransferase involved in cell wall biosynthesis
VAFISIVVPAYGDEPWLNRCIDSFREQRYPTAGHEIIVVDNGLTPAARKLVDDCPDVRVVETTKADPWEARNAGISAANGDVIAFTAADCAAAPDWLSMIDRAMGVAGTNVVVGCYLPANESFAATALAAWENEKNRYVFSSPADDMYCACTNNMAVRAELFEEVGPFRPRVRESEVAFARAVVETYGRNAIRYDPRVAVSQLEIGKSADYYRGMLARTRGARASGKKVPHRSLGMRERMVVLDRAVRTYGFSRIARARLLALLAAGLIARKVGAWLPASPDEADADSSGLGSRAPVGDRAKHRPMPVVLR